MAVVQGPRTLSRGIARSRFIILARTRVLFPSGRRLADTSCPKLITRSKNSPLFIALSRQSVAR